eukprot:8517577-Lingulodinium_polyedra.AAC.1
MPDVGSQGAPSAPSTRMRRGASYAEHTGPASQPGTPALASPARTRGRGTWSKAFRQSSAAPAMKRPDASASSSSTASSHASSSAPRSAPPPHAPIQAAMSRALPAAQTR